MRSFVDGSFIRSPTAASRRIQARARQFLEEYGDANPVLGFILATVADDEAEIQAAVPISVGRSEQYSFEPEGRPGWYQLSVGEPSAYRIDVMSSDGDPLVRVSRAEDPYTPLNFDDDGGAGTDARLEVLLNAGDYYLSVENLNAEAGAFTLLVQLLEP